MTLRVGVWQTAGRPGDPGGNIARLAAVLDEAKALGVDLLVTPELWSTGYNAPEAIRAFAEPPDGPTCAAVASLARSTGVAVAYGYPERGDQDAVIYNAAQLIGADGVRRLSYRKLHLWGDYEKALFRPGEARVGPVAYEGWQIGLSICYDTEFPETIRYLAVRGAELVLAPTALAAGAPEIPDLIVPARALESQVYLAFCNRCGDENGLSYQGASCVVDPRGVKIAAADTDEALLIADLSKDALKAARERAPYLKDIRADLLERP